MKKTLVILEKLCFLMIGFAFVALTTSCSKTCNCTTVQKISSADPDFEDITGGGNATFTQTIKKGKCSDLNSEVNQSMEGTTITMTTTCK